MVLSVLHGAESDRSFAFVHYARLPGMFIVNIIVISTASFFYLRFCVLCFNTVGWETGKASNTRFYGPDAFPVKKTECWCVDDGDLTEICLYYTSSCDHYHRLHHLCGDKILDGLTFWYRIDWCPGIWPLKASLFLSLNDDRKTRRRFYEQRMT